MLHSLKKTYRISLRIFVFACKKKKKVFSWKSTAFPLETLHSLAKALLCRRNARLCSLAKLFALSCRTYAISFKSIAFPWESLRLLVKHLRSLPKVLHSPENLCVILQKYYVPLRKVLSQNICILSQMHCIALRNFAFANKSIFKSVTFLNFCRNWMFIRI